MFDSNGEVVSNHPNSQWDPVLMDVESMAFRICHPHHEYRSASMFEFDLLHQQFKKQSTWTQEHIPQFECVEIAISRPHQDVQTRRCR